MGGLWRIAVGVVGLIAATIGIYFAVRQWGSTGVEAVQLSTSLLLVVITAFYVRFTHQMLHATRFPAEALRMQRELTAVQELSGRVLEFRQAVTAARRPYPLVRGQRPSPESLGPPTGLVEFLKDSFRLTLDLPPRVGGALSKFLLLLGFGYARTAGVLLGVAEEDQHAVAEHRDWSWDAFLTYMQHNHAKYWTGDEFERTARGGWIDDTEEALRELEVAVTTVLRPELVQAMKAGPDKDLARRMRL